MGKRSIYQTVQGTKQAIRDGRMKASFRNIPCHLNAAPDDMCRRARELQDNSQITLRPGDVPNLPPVDLEAVSCQQQAAQGSLPLPQARITVTGPPIVLEAVHRLPGPAG